MRKIALFLSFSALAIIFFNTPKSAIAQTEGLILSPSNGEIKVDINNIKPVNLSVKLTKVPVFPVKLSATVESSNSFATYSISPSEINFSTLNDDFNNSKFFTVTISGSPVANEKKVISITGTNGSQVYSGKYTISFGTSSLASANINLSPSSLTFKDLDSEGQEVGISLSTKPESDISVSFTDSNNMVSIVPSILQFNASNFSTAQKVKISPIKNITLSVNSTHITATGRTTNQEFKGTASISITNSVPTVKAPPDADCADNTSGAGRNCTLAERLADPTGFVYQGWRAIRATINILLLFALLVISFSNITRVNIDSYTLKKTLPNLVIGVLLANASFLIVKALADISTVAVYFFVELAGEKTFNAFIANSLITPVRETLNTIGVLVNNPVVAVLVIIIATLLVLIGFIWMAAILYARLVVIYLLTIIAPLAFIAYGIPGFDKYFKQWWQIFIKWMFMLPVMAALIWLMHLIGGDKSGDGQSWARVFILYFLFVNLLAIPTKLGGSIAEKVSKGFNKYTGLDAARKGISETASREGNILLNRTPVGNLKAFMQKSTALREEKLKAIQQKKANWAEKTFLGRQQAHNDDEMSTLKSDYDAIKASNAKDYYESNEGKRALREAVESELEKKMAETDRDNLKLQLKIDLQGEKGDLEDKTKKLRESIFKNKSFTDEIELAENIGVGNIAFDSMEMLKTIDEANDIKKKIKENNEKLEKGGLDEKESSRLNLENSELQEKLSTHTANFQHLKNRDEHKDEFGEYGSLDEVLKIYENKSESRTRIWKATLGRAKKIVNKSIDAQNEDTIENASAEEVTEMLDKYVKKIGDNFENAEDAKLAKKLFISGQYASFQKLIDEKAKRDKKTNKVDIGLRDGLLAMHAQKKIIAKPNDYRRKQVLENLLKSNNELDTENTIEFQGQNLNNRDVANDFARQANSKIGSMHKTPGDKIRSDATLPKNSPNDSTQDIILPKHLEGLPRPNFDLNNTESEEFRNYRNTHREDPRIVEDAYRQAGAAVNLPPPTDTTASDEGGDDDDE